MSNQVVRAHSEAWQWRFLKKVPGPVLVAAAGAIITVITVAYLGGCRHILPHSAVSLDKTTEVMATLRASGLFALAALSFLIASTIAMTFGFLFPWRTVAFATATGIGMIEVVGPFFDLYLWIETALILSIYVGIPVVGVCETMRRRYEPLRRFFSEREGEFERKMEEAEVQRDLSPVSREVRLIGDIVLVVYCLAVLSYWCGEAHTMKGLGLW